MIDPATIQRFVVTVKNHLLGVVRLTGKVLAAFVAAVFAGMGAGFVLGVTLALIAALGLAGVRVHPDEPALADVPAVVIDVTPSRA